MNLAPFVPPVAVLGAWLPFLWHRIEQHRDYFWIHVPVARTYLGLVEYVLPIALAVAVLAWDRRRPGRRRLALAASALATPVLLGPLAATLTARGDHNFVLERYFLPLAVLGALAVGFLLSRLPRPLAAAAAGLLLVASVLKPGDRFAYSDGMPHGTLSEDAAAFLRARPVAEPVFVAPDLQVYVLEYYGVQGRLAGGWACEGMPEELARWAAAASQGTAPRTAWVAHFDCPSDRVAPPFTHVVDQTRFGPLSLVRLSLAAEPSAAEGAGAVVRPPDWTGGSRFPDRPR